MTIDINKMFSDIIPDEAVVDRQRGMEEASVVGQLGGMAALYGPARSRRLRRSVGGALGLDTRNPQERLREQLSGVDLSTPAGQDQAFQLISAVDGNAGLRFRAAMAEQNRLQQQANAQSNAAAAQLTNANVNAAEFQAEQTALPDQNAALAAIAETSTQSPERVSALVRAAQSGLFNDNPQQLIDRLDPEAKDRYQVAGKNIWDNQKAEWVLSPAAEGGGALGLESIDADNYDTQSFRRYQDAVAAAATPAEQRAALDQLLPKAKDDWSWRKAENGDYVQWPTGEALQEQVTGVRKANSSARTVRSKANNVVEIMDGMLAGLAAGDVSTGIGGIIMEHIAGTNNYTFKGDINTIKANLGINALQEARDNSTNGASGFGQLTQRELERLEALIAEMQTGMSREDLVQRMNRIRDGFVETRDAAYSDWTLEEFLGLKEPKQASPSTASEVTTPSGNTYTVREN